MFTPEQIVYLNEFTNEPIKIFFNFLQLDFYIKPNVPREPQRMYLWMRPGHDG